jgi:hypothetical protein
MVGTNSEDEAKLIEREEGCFGQFLSDVWEVFDEVLRFVVVENS